MAEGPVRARTFVPLPAVVEAYRQLWTEKQQQQVLRQSCGTAGEPPSFRRFSTMSGAVSRVFSRRQTRSE